MEHLSAFTAAVILALAHIVGVWTSQLDLSKRLWKRRSWISLAAGISVAYVFMDILPELGEQQHRFEEDASTASMLVPQNRLYLLALISFVVFYGLDRFVLPARKAAGSHETAYRVRLIGFTAYSGMIGYLLVERAEKGMFSLVVYTFAMALHFLIVGRSLAEEHGLERQMPSRLLLAGSVLAGVLLGSLLHLSGASFARLFAILAGGVVITSLTHELPGKEGGRFLPFCIGAIVFAVILLLSEIVLT